MNGSGVCSQDIGVICGMVGGEPQIQHVGVQASNASFMCIERMGLMVETKVFMYWGSVSEGLALAFVISVRGIWWEKL